MVEFPDKVLGNIETPVEYVESKSKQPNTDWKKPLIQKHCIGGFFCNFEGGYHAGTGAF